MTQPGNTVFTSTDTKERFRVACDNIAQGIEGMDSEQRRLHLAWLENAASQHTFMEVLNRFARNGVLIDSEAVLDATNHWSETRDLMLVRIYEVLHKKLEPGDIPATPGDDGG